MGSEMCIRDSINGEGAEGERRAKTNNGIDKRKSTQNKKSSSVLMHDSTRVDEGGKLLLIN